MIRVRAITYGGSFPFSASGSDIVKLYDLTTLCEETEDKYQNPFTMPVAILLYKWVSEELKHQYNVALGKLRELEAHLGCVSGHCLKTKVEDKEIVPLSKPKLLSTIKGL